MGARHVVAEGVGLHWVAFMLPHAMFLLCRELGNLKERNIFHFISGTLTGVASEWDVEPHPL